MNIIKRNGSEMTFDGNKIVAAITKANNSSETASLTPEQIHDIADYVEYKCRKMNRAVSVEEIQDMVENQIMATGAFELARNYVRYRYQRTLVRKANTTDNRILSLIECNNEEVKQENSNKNPTVNSVQRDYMAGEVSKDLTQRLLLPPTSWRRTSRASSISTTPTISHSTCTTAIWSIWRICCRTAP